MKIKKRSFELYSWLGENRKLLYISVIINLLIFQYPGFFRHTFLFRYIRLIQTSISFASIYLAIKYYRKNKFLQIVSLFYIVFALSTLINRGSLSSYIFYFTSSYGFLVTSILFFQIDHKRFFSITSKYLFVVLLVHSLTILFMADGLLVIDTVNGLEKPVFFFGEANQSVIYVFVYFMVILMNYLYRKTKLNRNMLFVGGVLSIISIVLSKSETSYIGALAFALIYLVMLYLDNKFSILHSRKIINRIILTAFAGIILVNILVLLFRVQVLMPNLWNKFFSNDITFSGRTFIWDEAINILEKHPLLGLGAIDGRYIYIARVGRFFDSHNLFLQIYLMSGVIGLSLNLKLIVDTMFKASFSKHRELYILSIAAIISASIMFLLEFYSLQIIFFLYLMIQLYSIRIID